MKVPALAFSNFKFSHYILDLKESEFEEAKDAVIAMWFGVFELWTPLPSDIRMSKRELVFSYLIMWYLADMYPLRLTDGVMGTGGMPLNSKTIKSVNLQFRKLNLPASYEALGTNQFGVKAAEMIHYAPEMMGVYGGELL
jgi:hypothetical protein